MAGCRWSCDALARYATPVCQETYTILGFMGKVIFLASCVAVLSIEIIVLGGCSGELADIMQSGRTIGLGGLQGRWAGPVTPVADGCGPATTGLLTIRDGKFAFDPFQSTTVIDGLAGDSGQLAGSLTRVSNGQQMASISFTATESRRPSGEETIEGNLVSGRCRWAVSLKRA